MKAEKIVARANGAMEMLVDFMEDHTRSNVPSPGFYVYDWKRLAELVAYYFGDFVNDGKPADSEVEVGLKKMVDDYSNLPAGPIQPDEERTETN